jgi:hypothetical protein
MLLPAILGIAAPSSSAIMEVVHIHAPSSVLDSRPFEKPQARSKKKILGTNNEYHTVVYIRGFHGSEISQTKIFH